MACVQGTWWGVGGGVVGGWWGSRFWCRVSGWGWVLGLGCLVGGGVCLVGPGSWLAGGVTCGGLFPLDPSLTPPPHLLGVLWFLVRVVPLLGGGSCWLVAVLWVAVLFCWGGLVLWVACLAGCVLVGLFSTWGRGCCSRWSFRFGRVFVGACSVVAVSVGCVCVGGLFSSLLCCSRWVGRPGRSGSSSPPLSPPRYTTKLPRPPNSMGKITR